MTATGLQDPWGGGGRHRPTNVPKELALVCPPLLHSLGFSPSTPRPRGPGIPGSLPTGARRCCVHRPPPGSSGASGWPVCGPRCASGAVGRPPGLSPPLPGHRGAGEGAWAGATGGGSLQRETSHARWKAEPEHHVPAARRPPRPAGQAAHHSVPAREGVEEASVWTGPPEGTRAWPCTALYSLQTGQHPVSPWLPTSSPVCLDPPDGEEAEAGEGRGPSA